MMKKRIMMTKRGAGRGGAGSRRCLLAAVTAGLALFGTALCGCSPRPSPPPEAAGDAAAMPSDPARLSETAEREKRLPRLLDLGAHACIPCKMMAPILDELKKDYAAVFRTEFIDVWQDQAAGQKHGVKTIPTQIFFDAGGQELFRHEGFMSKEDILAKWKELGVELGQNSEVRSQKSE